MLHSINIPLTSSESGLVVEIIYYTFPIKHLALSLLPAILVIAIGVRWQVGWLVG